MVHFLIAIKNGGYRFKIDHAEAEQAQHAADDIGVRYLVLPLVIFPAPCFGRSLKQLMHNPMRTRPELLA